MNADVLNGADVLDMMVSCSYEPARIYLLTPYGLSSMAAATVSNAMATFAGKKKMVLQNTLATFASKEFSSSLCMLGSYGQGLYAVTNNDDW